MSYGGINHDKYMVGLQLLGTSFFLEKNSITNYELFLSSSLFIHGILVTVFTCSQNNSQNIFQCYYRNFKLIENFKLVELSPHQLNPVDSSENIVLLTLLSPIINQTLVPPIPVFRGLNRCIQYLFIHPQKYILYHSYSCYWSNVIRLIWIKDQV